MYQYRFRFVQTVHLLVLLLACLPQLAQAGRGSSSTTDDKPIVQLHRPNTGTLIEMVVSSRSMISESTRKAVTEYLMTLDRIHRQYASAHGVEIIEEGDAEMLVKKAPLAVPDLTPLCERTITYLIFLQVEMLDSALFRENIELAGTLRQQRKMVRLLKPEQRVFGDARDRVVAEIVRGFANINDLHIALGVPSRLDIHYPSNISTLEQVEQYLLLKADAVADNALRLVQAGG
jgi:hypothetical protein